MVQFYECCPFCGGALDHDALVVNLDTNIAFYGKRAVRLAPREAEILTALRDSYPQTLDFDKMVLKVYGASANVTPATLRNMIKHLRRKILSLGWLVLAVPKFGYRLEKIE